MGSKPFYLSQKFWSEVVSVLFAIYVVCLVVILLGLLCGLGSDIWYVICGSIGGFVIAFIHKKLE